jgi:hypothetical protein
VFALAMGEVFITSTKTLTMLVLKACGEGFMRSTAEASVFTRRNGSFYHLSFVIFYFMKGPAGGTESQNVVLVHLV